MDGKSAKHTTVKWDVNQQESNDLRGKCL